MIVVRNVTNDESLVESFQNVCNHNNSCDLAVVTDRRECEVEYYCLNGKSFYYKILQTDCKYQLHSL